MLISQLMWAAVELFGGENGDGVWNLFLASIFPLVKFLQYFMVNDLLTLSDSAMLLACSEICGRPLSSLLLQTQDAKPRCVLCSDG